MLNTIFHYSSIHILCFVINQTDLNVICWVTLETITMTDYNLATQQKLSSNSHLCMRCTFTESLFVGV